MLMVSSSGGGDVRVRGDVVTDDDASIGDNDIADTDSDVGISDKITYDEVSFDDDDVNLGNNDVIDAMMSAMTMKHWRRSRGDDDDKNWSEAS